MPVIANAAAGLRGVYIDGAGIQRDGPAVIVESAADQAAFWRNVQSANLSVASRVQNARAAKLAGNCR